MARRTTAKRTTQRRQKKAEAPTEVHSIPTFCRANGISVAFYHKLKKQGLGPREMHVGGRVLITFEATAEWRRAREQAG